MASKIYTENVINGQCFTNNDCPKSYCNLAHPDEPGMCHGKVVPTGKILIPLRGIAVGDGWIDPINMVGGYPEMVCGSFFFLLLIHSLYMLFFSFHMFLFLHTCFFQTFC